MSSSDDEYFDIDELQEEGKDAGKNKNYDDLSENSDQDEVNLIFFF